MRPQGRKPFVVRRRSAALLSGILLACALAAPARAETLRVGKAVGVAFSFVPLDVGIRQGLFAQNGIEIESTTFAGDARLQQAMAADGVDIALGSGPSMATATVASLFWRPGQGSPAAAGAGYEQALHRGISAQKRVVPEPRIQSGRGGRQQRDG